MRPSLGRIVLYAEPKQGQKFTKDGTLETIKSDHQLCSAIITAVNKDGSVSLQVFKTNTIIAVHDVQQSEQPKDGCFSFPVIQKAPELPPSQPAQPEKTPVELEIEAMELKLAELKTKQAQ